MRLLKKILIFIVQFNQFMLWHNPISIVALVGLYFNFRLLQNPFDSNIGITNSSFAIVATLSSLCFAYCRSIKDKEKKQEILYCAERFLHSAVLFLVASIIKYFLIQEQIKTLMANSNAAGVALFVLSLLPGILYLSSLVNGIAALREINSTLYNKKKAGQELKRLL